MARVSLRLIKLIFICCPWPDVGKKEVYGLSKRLACLQTFYSGYIWYIPHTTVLFRVNKSFFLCQDAGQTWQHFNPVELRFIQLFTQKYWSVNSSKYSPVSIPVSTHSKCPSIRSSSLIAIHRNSTTISIPSIRQFKRPSIYLHIYLRTFVWDREPATGRKTKKDEVERVLIQSLLKSCAFVCFCASYLENKRKGKERWWWVLFVLTPHQYSPPSLSALRVYRNHPLLVSFSFSSRLVYSRHVHWPS